MQDQTGSTVCSPAVHDGPILFSGPMVQAILKGRKTQTRRAIERMKGFRCKQFGPSDTKGYDWHFRCHRGIWQDMDHAEVISRCPYGQVGDRLWVREAWAVANIYDSVSPSSICADLPKGPRRPPTKVLYPATDRISAGVRCRPSIHMPRWASRITLELVDVRIEPLNEISYEDAEAEGIEPVGRGWRDYSGGAQLRMSGITSFQSLWQSINGVNSWTANPWVWVVEFRRV